jgi:hypothetical protein
LELGCCWQSSTRSVLLLPIHSDSDPGWLSRMGRPMARTICIGVLLLITCGQQAGGDIVHTFVHLVCFMC